MSTSFVIPYSDSFSKPITHLALILDGNGRWALMRGLPIIEGHRQGAETLRNIVRKVGKMKIPYLTVYAFSTENWKRSKIEISGIMKLLKYYLTKHLDEFMENDVRIRILGELSRFPQNIISAIEGAIEKSKNNKGLTLSIALNYGGRAELTRAARSLARKAFDKNIDPEMIDEALFEKHLYTEGIPDPDLLIRSGGEKRISNYLLWQMAYTEFVFMETLWPDFSEKDLQEGIEEFSKRQRRFGGDKRKSLTQTQDTKAV